MQPALSVCMPSTYLSRAALRRLIKAESYGIPSPESIEEHSDDDTDDSAENRLSCNSSIRQLSPSSSSISLTPTPNATPSSSPSPLNLPLRNDSATIFKESRRQATCSTDTANVHFKKRNATAASFSNTACSSANIFLQEPVLTLNIDKDCCNHLTTVKINRSFCLDSRCRADRRPSTTADDPLFQEDLNKRARPSTNNHHVQGDNFCKKEPVEDQLTAGNSGDCWNSPVLPNNSNRRSKPTTPHRIVCYSPAKTAARNATTANECDEVLSCQEQPPSHKRSTTTAMSASAAVRKDSCSNTATMKTRRRLNNKNSAKFIPYTVKNSKNNLPHSTNDQLLTTHNEIIANSCCTTKVSSSCLRTFVGNGKQQQQQRQQQQQTVAPLPTQTDRQRGSSTSQTVSTSAVVFNTAGNMQKSQTKCQTKPKQQHTATKTQKANKKQSTTTTAAKNGGGNNNRAISEFFPVRRSVRKTKTAVAEEMMRDLEKAILEERCDGLRIENFKDKGRGIVAERHFKRGEFVIEYVGDLINTSEAGKREQRYSLDENAGCYMYYFKYNDQQYCIDATADTGKFGRLVNHSRNGNLMTKIVVVQQVPHLVLIARDDIKPGEELCYDYGDRSKESLLHHPWLAF